IPYAPLYSNRSSALAVPWSLRPKLQWHRPRFPVVLHLLGDLVTVGLRWRWESVGLVWLCSVLAVRDDARARIENPAGRRASVLTTLALPVVGFLIWLLLRPTETRSQRRERRLFMALAEHELRAVPRTRVARRRRLPTYAPGGYEGGGGGA